MIYRALNCGVKYYALHKALGTTGHLGAVAFFIKLYIVSLDEVRFPGFF